MKHKRKWRSLGKKIAKEEEMTKIAKILSASQLNETAMRMAKEIREDPETQLALGLLWQSTSLLDRTQILPFNERSMN